jgi:uncharacterized protein
MPRPVKCRRVENLPEYTYFVPAGRKKCEVEEMLIKVDFRYILDSKKR